MTETMEREAILRAVLSQVPFDGWSATAYAAGLDAAGVGPDRAALLFPNGIDDVAGFFGQSVAHHLESALEGLADREPSVRWRIATGVRTLIELLSDHRESVRRLSPLAVRRGNATSLGTLYRVTDIIWRAAGDRSTDFNFYTKRGLLAGVVSATYLYWLDDESDDFGDTWTFLDRRIENVLQIQKFRGRIEKFGRKIGTPLDAWRKSPFSRGLRARTSPR
ncbi:MAG: COQ9 family protein [Proteobacteria bacterium]|nr:COQ9 family protein [Pseudomonadota bacterium]MDA1057531.1 COQ9 family protein [Pseudomonadota bacterium]